MRDFFPRPKTHSFEANSALMMTIIHKVFSVRFDQFFIWNKLKERKRHWTFLCKESYFIPFFEDLTNISFYENKSPFCQVGKVGKILKGSLDSIPSPSPSVKIQIMGGTVPPIIWIFTEGEGDGIKSRLSSEIVSTLAPYLSLKTLIIR